MKARGWAAVGVAVIFVLLALVGTGLWRPDSGLPAEVQPVSAAPAAAPVAPVPADPTPAPAPFPADPTPAPAPVPADPTPALAPVPADPTPAPVNPSPPQAPFPAPAASQMTLVKARGIYITGYAASNPAFRTELIDLVERSELNAVVIDVKNDEGDLTYQPAVPIGVPVRVSSNPIADLPGLIRDLRARGIYPIARIVTFKDNFLPREKPETAVHHAQGGVWADRNGIAWLNPYHKEAWEYNVAIARAAAHLGFAEIQFDYVRFPSDGNMAAIVYPNRDQRTRQQVIAEFLRYARAELTKVGVWTSADIFGVVTTAGDDQGIGQYLEELAGAVDILSPMIYPSHYAPGEFGFANPNGQPYETVLKALEAARGRLSTAFPQVRIRPWLQDFSWGQPPYGPNEVRAEIQATYDAGYDEWLLWNAANRYTEGAMLPKWQGAPGGRVGPQPAAGV